MVDWRMEKGEDIYIYRGRADLRRCYESEFYGEFRSARVIRHCLQAMGGGVGPMTWRRVGSRATRRHRTIRQKGRRNRAYNNSPTDLLIGQQVGWTNVWDPIISAAHETGKRRTGAVDKDGN